MAAKGASAIDSKLHWYKDAIIYELHIKAFSDSNGDGIGDFEGLLQQLDYLEFLGVTAIWLLPFYPSPLRDDGYDIADYYSINPNYGNINHLKKFIREAHKRNLKVITELVINHSSDQHPWFQRARRAPKGSPERDYYVWTDDPNQYNLVRIIFQDYEASNWTWDPVAQQYYWHRFFHHQPDLNFDNPAVQDEVFKMLDYWCRLGVDGFRLDAVPYLFERDGTNCENLPETHVYLKKLRKHVDENFPGTLLLAEANMWPEDSASYFGDGDECHMNYHFPVMPRMFMSLQMEDRYPITDIFDQTPEIPETCQWGMFLRNHDELTLEMVTDEERDYMYKVYVKDPKARINLGIRHRLAPLMSNNRRKIELLNCLLFSLPGTPIIYYGDEIGMGDNYYLGDRDGVRTPMQWSPDRNAGFSACNPQKLYLPVIQDPEYHYETVNVETQRRNPSSLLWFMKHMIQMRKRYKAFSRGDLKFINVENPKILAFTRTYEGQTLLIVANLSRFSQAAELDLAELNGYQPVELFSKNKFPAITGDKPYFLTLGSYDYQWFVLQKTHPLLDSEESLPQLTVSDWSQLMQPAVVEELEQRVLQGYMMQMRWFGGKGRGIQNIRIMDGAALPAKTHPSYLLLIEVAYESGLPEIYQLPVAIVRGEAAARLSEGCPQAVIARVNSEGGEEGVLCDALYTTELQLAIIRRLAGNETIELEGSEVRFYGNAQLTEHVGSQPEIRPRMLSADQSNTSITYDGKYFLKVYRKVDRAMNPDLEVTRYLTEAGYPYIPSFVGAIEWQFGKDTMVLGMVQELVEHRGDAWTYMLERLDTFNEKILSADVDHKPPTELKGSLVDPVPFEALPESLKNLLEAEVAERARLLGQRTGELHLALAAAAADPAFKPEDYSLHYQRSLFSSMQSLVRSAYQTLSRSLKKLPEDVRAEAESLVGKDEVLKQFKRIYAKKLDVTKIRTHGDYHLGQVLITGKDLVILDFEGEPARPYSERRLKRNPIRDVAGMVRSFHYAAYASLYLSNKVAKEDIEKLIPYVELWYHYMSGFFMQAYLETVKGSSFVPDSKADLEVLLQTFLMEKAFYELGYELNNRPGWARIPLRGIQSIMKQ